MAPELWAKSIYYAGLYADMPKAFIYLLLV
jgi:hypothetical protein